ncbi:hypothetical protein GCM10009817_23240 [Terrabacter lapilli]|uniref:Uncharacterized protein n=1 Tax=Terrabacter lapilli TaxID=436231 RepID=A0ABN2S6W3_9MICO
MVEDEGQAVLRAGDENLEVAAVGGADEVRVVAGHGHMQPRASPPVRLGAQRLQADDIDEIHETTVTA